MMLSAGAAVCSQERAHGGQLHQKGVLRLAEDGERHRLALVNDIRPLALSKALVCEVEISGL